MNSNCEGVGVGISVGICFGAALGAGLHSVGLGIACGVAFGVPIGMIFSAASDPASARKRSVWDRPPRYPLGL